MTHEQDTHGSGPVPRFYAWCPACGVCGPIRRTHETAAADDAAHDTVCTQQQRAAA